MVMPIEGHERRYRAVAREQVAGYRVDIRYKSGKEEPIQARQVEGVAGEIAENL
jgi:hypothetical protein